MTIKKTIPILLTIWLWLSAPFFSQISFMNKSFELIGKMLSKISPVDWLVPVLLLLGIPTFSFIFYHLRLSYFSLPVMTKKILIHIYPHRLYAFS
ncbi:MAG: hypothetical protein MUW51_03255 [Lactococcus lactis]|nr:hypothetical protein [Lactococcus lactis]